jgi:hypothetical protein
MGDMIALPTDEFPVALQFLVKLVVAGQGVVQPSECPQENMKLA